MDSAATSHKFPQPLTSICRKYTDISENYQSVETEVIKSENDLLLWLQTFEFYTNYSTAINKCNKIRYTCILMVITFLVEICFYPRPVVLIMVILLDAFTFLSFSFKVIIDFAHKQHQMDQTRISLNTSQGGDA